MASFRYKWKEDIWALHLELESNRGDAALARVTYEGSDSLEEFTVPARETMRFNLCRYDNQNTALRIDLPDGVTPRVYENLDRAFYTDIPTVDLEELAG